jgi:hypothetical protein
MSQRRKPASLDLLRDDRINLARFIDPGEPSDVDEDPVPDELGRLGVVTSIPFLELVDSGDFELSPCLCCYRLKPGLSARGSQASARRVAASLELLLQYYDAASYRASKAFDRAVAILTRDVRPADLTEVAEFLIKLESTPSDVREVNRLMADRLCIALPPCRPDTIWVYSTPDGRRLLRGLAKSAPGVRISLITFDCESFPRFRLRMYSAKLVDPTANPAGLPGSSVRASPDPSEPSAPPTGAARLLAIALQWAHKNSRSAR